jgi:NTP pyrophosphatase (non-canonical NTP hydrolase)
MDKIQNLIKVSAEIANRNGFYDTVKNTKLAIGLVAGEVFEALEAHRKNRRAEYNKFDADMEANPDQFEEWFKLYLKDSVEDELADAVIRIGHFCDYNKINLAINDWLVPHDVKTEEDIPVLIIVIAQHTLNLLDDHYDIKVDRLASAIFFLADKLKIDLWKHIELKMRYNSTRPYKHGKAY